MSGNLADRNLLIGILALQMDFIDRDQLVSAMNRWVLEKVKPLGQILLEDGVVEVDTRQLLDALADKHIELHGDDAEQSLQRVNSLGLSLDDFASDDLAETNEELRSTFAERTTPHVKGDDDAMGTLSFSVGDPTSKGQRFRVLRPHAKGGLGEIFVARDEELNREVALKQISEQFAADVDSRNRFTVEAEITGRLEHPNIVPVYGLGSHANGDPYYAMRLIHGNSLKEATAQLYKSTGADGRGLTAGSDAVEFRRLLASFISVCNAIEYAHSRGIVHRDIKPSNIMLGMYGETLVVDWGLAKPVDGPESPAVAAATKLRPSSGSHSTPTLMGSAIGTPAFMSPEQAFGHVDQVGPSSDIYCLGSTLYYLLTGQPPVVENDLGSTLRQVQASNFPRPREVHRSVPAALEAICLKAMAPRSQDRYPSASQLADDIEKWLAGEVVSAYAEPLRVRAGRWIRRHQSAVTGAAATVLVAVASLGVGVVALSSKNTQLQEANRRENKANVQLSRAKDMAEQRFEIALDSIDDYYTDVSEDVLLGQPGLRDLRRTLLTRPLGFYQRLQDELEGDANPKAQAALARAYSKVAEITADVGSQEEALRAHQQAVVILEELSTTSPSYRPQLARSYNLLGVLRRATGDFDGAMSAHQKAIKMREQLVKDVADSGAMKDDVAESYNNLGNLQRDIGEDANAALSYQHAIDIRQQLAIAYPTVSATRAGLARCYSNLGVVLRKMGKSADALAAQKGAVRLREELVQEHAEDRTFQDDLASSYNNLSVIQRVVGEAKEALASSQTSIDIREQLAGDHPNVIAYQQGLAASYNNNGNLHRADGDTAAALEAYKKVVAICHQLETDNPNNSDVQDSLARAHHNVGILQNKIDQDDAAIESFKKAIEIREAISAANPKDHTLQNDLAQSCLNLGVMYRAAGNHDQALLQYQRAIGIRTNLVEQAPKVVEFQEDLAACYNNLANLHASMKQTQEAMSCFKKALLIQERLVEADSENRDSQDHLARSYHNIGVMQRNNDQGDEALESWRNAIEIRDRLLSENPTVSAYAANLLKTHRLRAALLHDADRMTEAIASWDRAIELSPTSRRTTLRIRRAESLANTNDYESAVDEANELSSGSSRGDLLYEIACVVSDASATAAADSRLEQEARRTRAKQLAEQAVALLSNAAKLEYFDDQGNAEDLAEDSRLDPLRSFDAFKLLLESQREPEDK